MTISSAKEAATKRVPLKPSTFDRLREFVRGMDVSYDEALDALLDLVPETDKDALIAGRRFAQSLRDQSTTKRAER